MKRRFPGLHQASEPAEIPDGIYLVRVQKAQYRWHAQKSFYAVQFAVLEPKQFAGSVLAGRIYCTEKALWKLSWFSRDFGYDAELLGRDELEERALVKLRGVLKITHTIVNGTSLLNFDGFAPAASWEELSGSGRVEFGGGLMVYIFTQISQYLACPRRYRHRYLDGWQEKDFRAAMLFGRAFEKALAAYFRREDAAAAFFTEWSAFRDAELAYSGNDTWDRLLQEGFQLLDHFAQDDRVRIPRPRRNQQIKFTRPVPGRNEFVAYIDAIGKLDGIPCVLEWKTTSARYPEEPDGLLALDPQLVCYSWITRIAEVAQVVFVRKRLVEVQYLRTSITDAQRQEFAALLEDTVQQIDSGRFLPHSGIRFPQNPCLSCAYVGLCLAKPELTEAKLIRRPGGSLVGIFDELAY